MKPIKFRFIRWDPMDGVPSMSSSKCSNNVGFELPLCLIPLSLSCPHALADTDLNGGNRPEYTCTGQNNECLIESNCSQYTESRSMTSATRLPPLVQRCKSAFKNRCTSASARKSTPIMRNSTLVERALEAGEHNGSPRDGSPT